MKCKRFNRFIIKAMPHFQYRSAAASDSHGIFIEDKDRMISIYFDEEQVRTNETEQLPQGELVEVYRYRIDDKAIVQSRVMDKERNLRDIAMFRMEFEDEKGDRAFLSGHMTVGAGYSWSNGVEPVLKELLKSLSFAS